MLRGRLLSEDLQHVAEAWFHLLRALVMSSRRLSLAATLRRAATPEEFLALCGRKWARLQVCSCSTKEKAACKISNSSSTGTSSWRNKRGGLLVAAFASVSRGQGKQLQQKRDPGLGQTDHSQQAEEVMMMMMMI